MKTILNTLLVCAALMSGFAHADVRSRDGWPLPWPFPWAQECPMDWKNLSGVFQLDNSMDDGHLIVKISVLEKKGIRLVRVSRFSQHGRLMFDGTTFVTERQKVISLYLHGVSDLAGQPPVWAVIKMHYDSSVFSCTADHLVPILTVEAPDQTGPPAGVDYRMTKVQ